MGSLIGSLTKLTAALVACAALINGALDVYKTVANIPDGEQEKTNVALLNKNIGIKPIVEQPLEVAANNVKLPLLVQVFPSGDVLVRYGPTVQWLPFDSVVKVSHMSIFPEAHAQSPLPPQAPVAAPGAQQNRAIYIDLDKLKIEQASADAALSNASRIEKTYVLAEMKDDHPYLFNRSNQDYTKKFIAAPGYRIASFNFQVVSDNNYTPGKIEIVDDGKAIVATFRLRSGAAVNRYRGWVKGTLRTQQERVQ
jgi:hypothetical protein